MKNTKPISILDIMSEIDKIGRGRLTILTPGKTLKESFTYTPPKKSKTKVHAIYRVAIKSRKSLCGRIIKETLDPKESKERITCQLCRAKLDKEGYLLWAIKKGYV